MGVPVVHFEIGCRNSEKAASFYAQLFGWNIQEYGGVRMFDTGTKEGIQGHVNALGHEPHKYITVYALVDDIPAYLSKAEKLGGKTVVPMTEVPGMGHFAWFCDPDGNIFGLWKAMQM
mgnify:CR=1 FL=1